jgi:hypothetical protein
MSDDDISLEVCLFSDKIFGVEPTSILPEIKRIDNGSVSEIIYQYYC